MVNIRIVAAWIISLVATGGSLYFSEIRNFVPCELCWFQRIFMYPIIIILGIGLMTKDNAVTKYVLSLSIPGLLLSLYHIAVQKIGIAADKPCRIDEQCATEYINWFGFITIPFLAFLAFFILTILLLATKDSKR